MGRFIGADWRPIANLYPNQMNHPVRGVIMHVIVGTVEAADGLFRYHPERASAHFGIKKDGYIRQWVDTNDKANAQGTGNRDWVSVETEGQPSEALTDAQVRAFARIYRWVHDLDAIPFQVTDSTSGRGLGTHVMGGAAWGGHTCPGPGPRAGQRQAIIDLARQGAPAPTDPQEDFLSALNDAQQRELYDHARIIDSELQDRVREATKPILAKANATALQVKDIEDAVNAIRQHLGV